MGIHRERLCREAHDTVALTLAQGGLCGADTLVRQKPHEPRRGRRRGPRRARFWRHRVEVPLSAGGAQLRNPDAIEIERPARARTTWGQPPPAVRRSAAPRSTLTRFVSGHAFKTCQANRSCDAPLGAAGSEFAHPDEEGPTWAMLEPALRSTPPVRRQECPRHTVGFQRNLLPASGSPAPLVLRRSPCAAPRLLARRA